MAPGGTLTELRGWSRAEKGLVLLFVLLAPFQDSGLAGTPLRVLGSSFAILPLMILCCLRLLRRGLDGNLQLRPAWLAGGLWVLVVNLLALLRHGADWNGASLPEKTLNLLVQLALVVYVVRGIPWAHFRWLPGAMLGSFLITLAGIALYDLNLGGLRPLFESPVFHFRANPDTRWHGFSSEASVLSFTVGAQGLLCAALWESTRARIAILATTVLALTFCGSKGGLAVLLAAIAVAGLIMPGRRAVALLTLAGIAPLLPVAADRIEAAVTERALRETTTFSTRSSMAIWTLLVVQHHPLGAGCAGFYASLTRYLPDAMDRAARSVPVVHNFSEARSYLSAPQYVGTKTLLGDMAAYFGLPFLLFSAALVIRTLAALRRRRDYWLTSAVLFLCLAWSTYMASLALYPGYICLGVALAAATAPTERRRRQE